MEVVVGLIGFLVFALIMLLLFYLTGFIFNWISSGSFRIAKDIEVSDTIAGGGALFIICVVIFISIIMCYDLGNQILNQ